MPPAATGVIVVAAGAGARLERDLPKAFVEVAGSTILERALSSVFAMSEPVQVIVVAPQSHLDEARRIADAAAGPASGSITIVAGGATRQRSVAAGLAALGPSVETVLVHDSARAFTPTAVFDAVVAAVRSTRAGVIPGMPVTDTIKKVDAALATETVDRSQLTAVQTPQGFPRDELDAAYLAATREFTDDAALYAAAGHPVQVVPGDALAFKITTPWDLRRAESLAEGGLSSAPARIETSPAATQPIFRTGIGVDVHAYDDGEPLWLGGLYWPDEVGLAGHSDGDAIAHAICDALLSAAGLGDMGSRFGTSDPRFENAHGDVFLLETAKLVRGAGFRIENVAVQVIGSTPRLSPRRLEIEGRLGELLQAQVSVSATTTDGLGFTGRSEGLTAIATALLSTYPVHGDR